MKSVSKLFLILLLIGLSHSIQAQIPQVLSIEPESLNNSADRFGPIVVQFDEPIVPTTVNEATFVVFGRWSGPATGEFEFSDELDMVSFWPDEPFFAGEWVTVTLTKEIKSFFDEGMLTAYNWNFFVKTQPGTLIQDSIGILSVRQDGEGHIQSYGAYAGDLNNDGWSDLSVVNEITDDVRIFLNDGDGAYEDFTIVDMGNKTPSPNEGGDFDLDGEIDLAVSTGHENEMRVLFGDGTGLLDHEDTYSTGDAARGLVVIDHDGDGDQDIITANRNSNNLTRFYNDGTGEFTSNTIDPDGEGESGLAVADMNDDGILDLVVGMYTSQEVSVLQGNGFGGFTESDRVFVGGNPWMVAVGDINNDGMADVVSVNSFGNFASVLFGMGDGTLHEPLTVQMNDITLPIAVDLGDIDGDGYLDMVTSNYESANFVVWRNDGTGIFIAEDIIETPGNASCAILHDRDNDGDLDITCTDETEDLLLFYRNGEPVATIEPISDNSPFKAFPVPFEADLYFESMEDLPGDYEIVIYDESGVVRFQQEISILPNEKGSAFKVSPVIQTGVYYYLLKGEDSSYSGSLIKK